MKILAVDDDEIALALLSETLKAAGYTDVSTSASGQDALAQIAAASRPFDCFLLDIQMPGMDGIELCRRIRALQEYLSAPIIMITAMSDRSYIDGAFAAGAMDYVSKPFDALELGVRVRMADSLVREKRISTKNLFAASALKAKVSDALRFSPDDAVTITDVPQVIGKLAMENYLLQLSSGKVFQSTAVAFAIAEFQTIFSQSTPTEMLDTLTDVAEAIALSLKHTNHLMTYCGRGEFVCITGRADPILGDDLAYEIQWAIDEMGIVYSSGKPCEITLIMGKPYTPSILAAWHPLEIMNNALISVEDKKAALRRATSGSASVSIWRRLAKAV